MILFYCNILRLLYCFVSRDGGIAFDTVDNPVQRDSDIARICASEQCIMNALIYRPCYLLFIFTSILMLHSTDE